MDTTTLFGVPVFELVGLLQEVLEDVCSDVGKEFAFSFGKYYVYVNECVVLVCDEHYRLLDFADLTDVADKDEEDDLPDVICPFIATRSIFSRMLAEVSYEDGDRAELLRIMLVDESELIERMSNMNPKWLCADGKRTEICERRKVLFTHGMGNDRMLIITDAPKEAIEAWCRRCVAEMENGENTYFDTLKSQYYVRELLDSEEHDIEDVEIIGYDEEYELTDYYDFSDE